MGGKLLLLFSLFALLILFAAKADPGAEKFLALVMLGSAFMFFLYLLQKMSERRVDSSFFLRYFKFMVRHIDVSLQKDRRYMPRSLVMVVRNNKRRDVDLEPPVLIFRKLLLTRKFRLKGMNHYQIYPLLLESGKVHELRIDLSNFYGYDKTLKYYYWSRVFVKEKGGRRYYSGYITLRKSLFS